MGCVPGGELRGSPPARKVQLLVLGLGRLGEGEWGGGWVTREHLGGPLVVPWHLAPGTWHLTPGISLATPGTRCMLVSISTAQWFWWLGAGGWGRGIGRGGLGGDG